MINHLEIQMQNRKGITNHRNVVVFRHKCEHFLHPKPK